MVGWFRGQQLSLALSESMGKRRRMAGHGLGIYFPLQTPLVSFTVSRAASGNSLTRFH